MGMNIVKTKIVTPYDIWEIASDFKKSRVLLTAYELSIFSAIGDKSKTSVEVAKILKIPERSTDRLMNALCALGLLNKKKGKFSNTPSGLRFLVKSRPGFMGGLMHVVHMWDNWSALTQAVKGRKTFLNRRLDKRDKKWTSAFIAAMHEIACPQAKSIVSLLNLSGVSKVLDVGGGSGAYSMSFVRRKKSIGAAVFDLPGVIPLAKKYVRKEKLLDKIKFISGDYRTDKLGTGFDLVFLSAIIHINSFKQNCALIKKCVKALNPHGQLVVQDFIMDEDRTGPVMGALFALNMLVATESGDTYTESEVKAWMREAGLSKIERKNTAFGTTLIIGRKVKIS